MGASHASLTSGKFTDLASKPRFAALSYVWGDPSDTEEILLNGRQWPVTKSLAMALRHVKRHWMLEYPDEDPSSFRLWVDVLCINQKDLEERASQVSRMQYLYALADVIFAWLEEGDEMIYLAFDAVEVLYKALTEPPNFVDDIGNLTWLKRVPALCEDDRDSDEPEYIEHSNSRWDALHQFFFLPYWERVWIFQEVVMARRLVYCSPTHRLSSVHLGKVAQVMSTLRRLKTEKSVPRPAFISLSSWNSLYSPIINWSIPTSIEEAKKNESLVSDHKLDSVDRTVSAIQLSGFAGNFKATDPKDHVYGLLGLTRMQIAPDYRDETSYIDVYCDYVAHCIQLYPLEGHHEVDELFFLDYAGAGDRMGNELPSWVPDYPTQSTKRRRLHLPKNVRADADVFYSPYKEPKAIVLGRTLNVVGLAVQEVKSVHNCLNEDFSQPLEYFIDFCSRNEMDATGTPSLQALFRVFDTTLKADKHLSLERILGFLLVLMLSGLPPVRERRQYVLDVSLKLGRRSDESFDNWIVRTFLSREMAMAYSEKTADGPKDMLLTTLSASREQFFMTQVEQNTIKSRELEKIGAHFLETEDGYLGIAPRGVLPGDSVVVVKGYRAPLILRRDGENHIFIGSCFVLGLMMGQARKWDEAGKVVPKLFTLK